jgi:hypothetical protein
MNKAQIKETVREIVQAYNEGNASYMELLDEVEGKDRDAILDYPLWSAGENMPGYMPEAPYCLFMTERAARGYCRQLAREAGGGEYVQDMMQVTLRDGLS